MKKLILSLSAIASFSICVSAQAYIPEAGFENWSSTGFGVPNQPNGWMSGNIFNNAFMTQNAGIVFCTAAGTPDNYQGTFSMRLETKTLAYNPPGSGIPNTFGFAVTGSVIATAPYLRAGYSTQQRPASFSYASKYSPMGGDTAWCIVAITHWNGTSRDTIAAGFDYYTAASSTYSVRNVTLIYNAAFAAVQPDTAAIWFSPSSFVSPVVGSVIYVDDANFTGYVGVDENSIANGVDVYPNPSSTFTNFDVVSENANQVVVYDMTGREITSAMILNKKATVNSYDLASGIYSYSVITKEGDVLSRGKFSVAQ